MVNNEYAILDVRVKSFPTGKNGWPYRKTEPCSSKQCARAGFYYYESSDYKADAVQCYICKVILDSWDTTSDDPFQRHVRESPNCAWAALVCIKKAQPNSVTRMMKASEIDETLADTWIKALLQLENDDEDDDDDSDEDEDEDDDDKEALRNEIKTGRSARMEQWRLDTFGDWWPYDDKDESNLLSKEMVKAGFIYLPGQDSMDAVVCVHCGVNLDGWEPEDDPVHEHKRRCAVCPFFAGWPKEKGTSDKTGKSSVQAKEEKSKTRQKKRTRKAAEEEEEDDDNDEEEDEMIDVKAKQQQDPAPKRRKQQAKQEEEDEEEEEEEEEEEDGTSNDDDHSSKDNQIEEMTVEEYIKEIVEEQIARLKAEGARLIELLKKHTR
ncbi:hypothetical protein BDF22DRAFT_674451 [Syncephalis plumigaleata]|nr:hypothetical protein BDF22DRAFT_674451 [Syncephalis plumigaleata]